MEYRSERHIGDILKDRNIILRNADAATRGGFTQVPNFLLKSKHFSPGDKLAFAMLLRDVRIKAANKEKIEVSGHGGIVELTPPLCSRRASAWCDSAG